MCVFICFLFSSWLLFCMFVIFAELLLLSCVNSALNTHFSIKQVDFDDVSFLEKPPPTLVVVWFELFAQDFELFVNC